jgi:hypothetical protein
VTVREWTERQRQIWAALEVSCRESGERWHASGAIRDRIVGAAPRLTTVEVLGALYSRRFVLRRGEVSGPAGYEWRVDDGVRCECGRAVYLHADEDHDFLPVWVARRRPSSLPAREAVQS